MRPAVVAILTLMSATSAQALDVVERRSGAGRVEGEIRVVDENGVEILSSGGGVQIVPWDRVRSVQTSGPRRREAEQFTSVSNDLWRARSRVERGDTSLAEPLFEKLFERYRGKTHETALVVAEGLLRCRLARGDTYFAILPALETARLRRSGTTTDSYAHLEAALDPSTALCPALAPAWTRSPSLARLEAELAKYDARGDEIIASISGLYLRAVQQTLGSVSAGSKMPSSDASTPRGPRHDAVALLGMVVRCGGADEADRKAAVGQLQHQLDDLTSWKEAWARYAIGHALLREGEPLERRQLGMLSLLHLPARFGASQPQLAALALSAVSAELDREGQDKAAAALRDEFKRLTSGAFSAPGNATPTGISRQKGTG